MTGILKINQIYRLFPMNVIKLNDRTNCLFIETNIKQDFREKVMFASLGKK